MKNPARLLVTALVLSGSILSAEAGPKVLVKTSQGDITIELNEEKAPETVKNFLVYVNEGFFDNTVFHRVIKDFMIQGGGFALKEDGTIEQKETKAPIQNEAKNGLKNKKGTIAMARTPDPHSATAQFFINHKYNDFLDFPSSDGWGYAVFGEVVAGIEVVDKIAAVATGPQDVPNENVVIQSIKVVTE